MLFLAAALFPAGLGIWLSRRRLVRSHRAHFRAQAFDEMLDMERQRRAAFHRNVSVEPGRLDNPEQLDAGIAAMGDGELVDHGNAEAGLDQRAYGGAEARADGDVVTEFLARKYLRHDPPIGIVGIDADQRIADDLGSRDLLASREFVPRRYDAEQLARRQRQEIEAGMIEPVTHGDAIA